MIKIYLRTDYSTLFYIPHITFLRNVNISNQGGGGTKRLHDYGGGLCNLYIAPNFQHTFNNSLTLLETRGLTNDYQLQGGP